MILKTGSKQLSFTETYNQILKKLLQFHIDEQSCIRQYELKVTYIYINNILI